MSYTAEPGWRTVPTSWWSVNMPCGSGCDCARTMAGARTKRAAMPTLMAAGKQVANMRGLSGSGCWGLACIFLRFGFAFPQGLKPQHLLGLDVQAEAGTLQDAEAGCNIADRMRRTLTGRANYSSR